MCDPILVTLLKMLPHYSQSSSENATPSGGTSPLLERIKLAAKTVDEDPASCKRCISRKEIKSAKI